MRQIFTVVGLLFFSSLPCVSSQVSEGGLAGSVRDPRNASVPDAKVEIQAEGQPLRRESSTNGLGSFRFVALPPGDYRVRIESAGFNVFESLVHVGTGSESTLNARLTVAVAGQVVSVNANPESISQESIQTTSSVIGATVGRRDIGGIPLAHRSFANIAYIAPMTAPVEPSDPTKARITAVSFGGSSGLNVDLSIDGGDNNDDYIGGFLQNYSPDAMQEFTVRTAQFDANTSRTNGGSIIVSTRRGGERWRGELGGYFRSSAFNARNTLDNPEPNPKQHFSRQNGVADAGGPLKKGKAWLFTSLEYVHEDASVAYSDFTLGEFNALAQVASKGLIPGVPSIAVPGSTPVPFRDTLFMTRVDWDQSARSHWFFRDALDRNHAKNDLVQQATLPSTGATTTSNYHSLLISQQRDVSSAWFGSFVAQASEFHHEKERNSHIGLALAFPFSASYHTTSGFETFGDNQFVTPITAFPIRRDQQKYQLRYDLSHVRPAHSLSFGVNFIHEPVLTGALAADAETLYHLPADPSFYLLNPLQFTADLNDPENQTVVPAGDGTFSQSVRRLGMYAQDSWRLTPRLALNYGLRYDTTFGLFLASGRDQGQNPAVQTIRALGLNLPSGIPHDYRKAFSPRLGLAFAPGNDGRTVLRAGIGMYYNDLSQNGWVDAFRAVNEASTGLLSAGDQGAVIDPGYRTPYSLQVSAAVERELSGSWTCSMEFEHQQGVHQYRRYEYAGGVTLIGSDPAVVPPNLSLFRTDNRSRYDGMSVLVRHRFDKRLEFTAHYTLARATTWGAVVGELFDYVNGVSDVRNAFGPGDHGPSGEDIRHRFVAAGSVRLPWKIEGSLLAQFESARPFTLANGAVDSNGDGIAGNDRAVVNGVQTSLDQFRGTPFAQVDLRVGREIKLREKVAIRTFAEFFNLFDRMNPGNNYVGDVGALNTVPSEVQSGNIQHLCIDAGCTRLSPITSLNQLRKPGGALGDFFGPGTTVGIPFAAQIGFRLEF